MSEVLPPVRRTSKGWVLDIVLSFLGVAGLVLAGLGVQLMYSSNYEPPPVPVGFVLGQAFLIPGSAIILNSSLNLGVLFSELKPTKKITFGFNIGWGVIIVAFGVLRFWVGNPFALDPCPCPAFHFPNEGGCSPCPAFNETNCNDEECVCGRGVCDEESSGLCFCDPNWGPGGGVACNDCSENAMNASTGPCSRCSRRFMPDRNGHCRLCRPGYEGANCERCMEGFVDGGEPGNPLCDPVQPGCRTDVPRYGMFCEPCPDCTVHGDTLAVPRSNNQLDLPELFTFNGQTCEYDHECKGFWCRGLCSNGPRAGLLCIEDDECPLSQCENRVCAAEHRIVASPECQCGRAGYFGPLCERCLGFDGVYSSTVCYGRGVCAAKYTGEIGAETYSHLECLCNRVGEEEWPAYDGQFCQKVVDESGVIDCSPGFYGSDCDMCPGGGGISACGAHGTCSDGIEGSGLCTCDQDERAGGRGYWNNTDCTECGQHHFWGQRCQPCPNLQLWGSSEACSAFDATFPYWAESPPNFDVCFNSCPFSEQCEAGREGTGICYE